MKATKHFPFIVMATKQCIFNYANYVTEMHELLQSLDEEKHKSSVLRWWKCCKNERRFIQHYSKQHTQTRKQLYNYYYYRILQKYNQVLLQGQDVMTNI